MAHKANDIQLLILPGLGGDSRMTRSQHTLPYKLITPNYIPFHRHESLAAYAKRFASLLVQQHAIDIDQPLIIAGHSLGGAIAIEMAHVLPVLGLILIGGPLSSEEIRFLPRSFGRMFAGLLPLWAYDVAEVFIPAVMRKSSGLSEEDIILSKAMYRALPRGLFRDAYWAIVHWRGTRIHVPYLRIHGELDHRIACPQPGENVIVIPKAKHMVGQSNSELVNDAIKSFITAVATGNE